MLCPVDRAAAPRAGCTLSCAAAAPLRLPQTNRGGATCIVVQAKRHEGLFAGHHLPRQLQQAFHRPAVKGVDLGIAPLHSEGDGVGAPGGQAKDQR